MRSAAGTGRALISVSKCLPQSGWYGTRYVRELGSKWKSVLSKDDSALGIDHYTRKGVQELLRQLEEDLLVAEDEPPLTFPWR